MKKIFISSDHAGYNLKEKIKKKFFKKFKFDDLGTIAKAKGFLLVSSSPLTRSSYHADEDFAKLQQNRLKSN